MKRKKARKPSATLKQKVFLNNACTFEPQLNEPSTKREEEIANRYFIEGQESGKRIGREVATKEHAMADKSKELEAFVQASNALSQAMEALARMWIDRRR